MRSSGMHSGTFDFCILRGRDNNFQLDVSTLEHETDFLSLNI